MNRFFNLLLVGILLFNNACKDDDPKPNLGGAEPTAFEVDFTLGKESEEEAIKLVKGKDCYYVVANTRANYDGENAFDDFNGGYGDMFITKINNDGTQAWSKCFGDVKSEFAVDALVGDNDVLFIAGRSVVENAGTGGVKPSLNSQNIIVYSVNSDGEVAWKTERVIDGQDETPYAIMKHNGNLKVFCRPRSKAMCMEFNLSSGEFLKETLINTYCRNISSNSIVTSDNGFLLVGKTNQFAGAVKLNANLDIEWDRMYGGNSHQCLNDVIEIDGGFFYTGWTNSDNKGYGNDIVGGRFKICNGSNRDNEVYLLKTDKNGEIKCALDNPSAQDNVGWHIGIGYLRSGWEGSVGTRGMNLEFDGGIRIVEGQNDLITVFSNSVKHKGADADEGLGQKTLGYEEGLMALSLDVTYNMADETNNDQTVIWENTFYTHVMKSKSFNVNLTKVVDIIPIAGGHMLISEDDGDVKVKTVYAD